MSREWERAAVDLAAADPLMRELFAAYGVPERGRGGFDPGRARPVSELDTFGFLVEVVAYQQVSQASAREVVARLEALSAMTPTTWLSCPDAELAATGLTRQRRRWLRELAERVLTGAVDLESWGALAAHEAERRLRALRGVGAWSAQMVLLFHWEHLDVWPVGDVALRRGIARHLGRAVSALEAVALGEGYRPWRSLAALWFWADEHHAQVTLSQRRRCMIARSIHRENLRPISR